MGKMTSDELIKRFPNASKHFIRSNASDAGGVRDCAFVQKQQGDDHQRAERQTTSKAIAHHEAGISKGHGGDHGVFALTITFRIPNRIRRDLDGMLATLCDCIRNARGRCLDTHPGDSSKGGTVRARRGRRDNHNPENQVSKVPF